MFTRMRLILSQRGVHFRFWFGRGAAVPTKIL